MGQRFPETHISKKALSKLPLGKFVSMSKAKEPNGGMEDYVIVWMCYYENGHRVIKKFDRLTGEERYV